MDVFNDQIKRWPAHELERRHATADFFPKTREQCDGLRRRGDCSSIG